MKEALTSFDLMALVAEWQGLVAGFIDKVYQAKDEVSLRINVSREERKELYCKAGKWLVLHRTEEKRESPGPFAMALRKSIDNARITAIEQRGFDRVAIVRLDKGSTYELVFEMFGKGNVVLVQGGNTVAAMRTQSFRGRQIRAGIAYDFPPAGTNRLELDREGFRTAVRSAKGQVVKVLASPLNLGGTYAEELCLRAGVAKDAPVASLTDADLDALFTALNNLAVAVEQERRPAVVLEGGKPIDAVPIDLLLHAGRERREFPTFNDAFSAYIASIAVEPAARDDATATLRHRVAQLKENIDSLRSEAMAAEAKALFLYNHFPLFEELLKAVREEKPFGEVQIKGVDKEKGTVTVAVGDFEAIELDYRKDGDRYAHADVHGAPSVVVKDGAKAGEATLREACEFALIYSKAWPAGLSGGSAFWVLPEQVSKQAESGEFLPRGGFVVRGKRNYVHDIPVEMAVGEAEVEGVRKVMGGPVSALAARSTKYVVLRPGEMDRDRLVAHLAKAFEVPEEEVSRVLPSGGFAILKVHDLELGLDTAA